MYPKITIKKPIITEEENKKNIERLRQILTDIAYGKYQWTTKLVDLRRNKINNR